MTREQLQLLVPTAGTEKIVSGKEFLDAIHVNEIFGAPYRSFVTGIKVDSLIAIDRKT